MKNFSDSEIFLSRLNELIDEYADGKYTVFARLVDIPVGTFHNIMKGQAPNIEHLISISKNFHVSIDWLLTGRGAAYLETVNFNIDEDDVHSEVPDEAIEIDHNNIVKQFIDKPLARNISMELVKIEKMDKAQFREIGAFIMGISKGLARMPIGHDVSGRRKHDRRIEDNPDQIPDSQDRRSGKDRRKAGVKR